MVRLTPAQVVVIKSMFRDECVVRAFLKMPDKRGYVHASGGNGLNSSGVLIRDDGQSLGISWDTLNSLKKRQYA